MIKNHTLGEIKKSLSDLRLEELQQVKIWLDKYLENAENKVRSLELEGETRVIEEIERNNKTYKLQLIRCGKETCKCATGALHGPYWYAYWLENGKTKSKYLGKKFPFS